MEGRDSICAAGHGAGHKARGQAEAPGRVGGDGCEASLVFFPTLCLNLPLWCHNSPFLLCHTHGGFLRSSVRGTNLTADPVSPKGLLELLMPPATPAPERIPETSSW